MRQRRQWQPTPGLLPGKPHGRRSLVGCSPWGREELDTTERLHFHALEKEMATHSSVLAWRIPGTGEPGGLPSMGSHGVGPDWSDLAAAAPAWGKGRGEWEVIATGYCYFFFWGDENILGLDTVMVLQLYESLKTTELFTLTEWILWYINCISIKTKTCVIYVHRNQTL